MVVYKSFKKVALTLMQTLIGKLRLNFGDIDQIDNYVNVSKICSIDSAI